MGIERSGFESDHRDGSLQMNVEVRELLFRFSSRCVGDNNTKSHFLENDIILHHHSLLCRKSSLSVRVSDVEVVLGR